MSCPELSQVSECWSYHEELPAIAAWLGALSQAERDQEQTAFTGSLEDTEASPSLDRFLARLCKFGGCTPDVFVMSAVYVQRYCLATQQPLSRQSIHRVTLAAFVTAAKVRDDSCFSNAFYAQLGGVPVKELNALERAFLTTLDWQMEVSFADHHTILRCLAASRHSGEEEVESELLDILPVAVDERCSSFLSARSGSFASMQASSMESMLSAQASSPQACHSQSLRNILTKLAADIPTVEVVEE